ncbi:MAG: amidohydrolase [Thermoprotei archaeon]
MGVLLKEVYAAYDPDTGRERRNTNIYVEEGVIRGLGERLGEHWKSDFVVDCKRKIVIPGFANAHTHLAMSLFRGYADELSLQDWLNTKIWPAEQRLNQRVVHAAALLSGLELLHSGVTAVGDMYFFEDSVASAVTSLGIRILAAPPVFSNGFMGSNLSEAVKTTESIGESALLKWALGPHSLYACDRETLERIRDLADQKSLRVHIHIGESRLSQITAERSYSKREWEVLEELGLVTHRLIAAHSVWVTKREIELAAKGGANVVFCPVSNAKLAEGGVAPIPEMLGAGVNVCFGTDGPASNNSLSVHETIKFGSLIIKNHRWDPTALDAATSLKMATTNGYRALGFPTPGLIAGAAADLITIPLSPSLYGHPKAPLPSLVVYSSISVADVIVNGEPVMLDSQAVKLDEHKIIDEFEGAVSDMDS